MPPSAFVIFFCCDQDRLEEAIRVAHEAGDEQLVLWVTRSLAYTLRVCSNERTLTDTEVGAARQSCIDAVAEATGALLRS